MASKTTQICIGFHSTGHCTTQFAVALSGLVRYEGSKVTSVIHIPSPYVTEARNKIVKRFLTQTSASHLLMVDVDLQFPEDALSLTLADMSKEKAEIIFGCYALGDFRPSIFAPPGSEKDHLPTVAQGLEFGLTYEIYAGSTGWLLATREAYDKVWDANKEKNWPWFDHDPEHAGSLSDGRRADLPQPGNDLIRIGEDFTFSKRAREAGLKLWGTTSPLLIHDKMQPLLNSFATEEAQRRGLTVNYDQYSKEKKDELESGVRSGELPVEQPEACSGGIPRSEGTSGENQEQGEREGTGE